MMLCLISSNLIIALSSSLITKQELTKAAYSTIYGMIDAVAVDVNAKNETYFSSLDTLSYVPYSRDSSHTLREKTDWLNSIAENDNLFKIIAQYKVHFNTIKLNLNFVLYFLLLL